MGSGCRGALNKVHAHLQAAADADSSASTDATSPVPDGAVPGHMTANPQPDSMRPSSVVDSNSPLMSMR